MLGWVVTVLAVAYGAGLLWLRRGIAVARSAAAAGTGESAPSVTVVVPARNEAQTIGRCLQRLMDQRYPKDRFEVIVVDDRSEDGTGDVVRAVAGEEDLVRLVRVDRTPPGIAPKKYAIDTAIREARGEVILTTDADCEPPPRWVETMASLFDDATGAVLGFSPLVLGKMPGWLSGLYRLDSLAMASLAAGGVGIGYPLTCSGRNFAYRKRVYEELGGFGRYAGVTSGDDDLLLTRIRDETDWEVRYCFAAEGHVPARPVTSVRAFWNQRARHASKGMIYPPQVRWLLIGVYLFNLGFVISLAQAIFAGLVFPFILSWLFKVSAELSLLTRASRALDFKAPLWLVPFVSMVHAVYVVVFGLAGQVRSFEWKGQSFRPVISSGGSL